MGPELEKCERVEEATESSVSAVERLVMPSVTGYVSYDVKVQCPHCDKRLQLNQYPYVNGENEEYEHAEDELGGELFGSTHTPARWKDFEIEYKCCGCKKQFIITAFDL